MEVPASKLFPALLPQTPRQVGEENPKFSCHSPQRGEIHADALAFGHLLIFEGERAEELPMYSGQYENVRAFHKF